MKIKVNVIFLNERGAVEQQTSSIENVSITSNDKIKIFDRSCDVINRCGYFISDANDWVPPHRVLRVTLVEETTTNA